MKGVVLGSVIPNAGDELLVRVALELAKISGIEINAMTGMEVPPVMRQEFPKCFLEPHSKRRQNQISLSKKSRFARYAHRLMGSNLRARIYSETIDSLGEFDLFLSAPGGYLNSTYKVDFIERIGFFEELLSRGNSGILLPQSIGPLSPEMDYGKFREVLSGMLGIFVRDDASLLALSQIGYHMSNVHRTRDMALFPGLMKLCLSRSSAIPAGVEEVLKNPRCNGIVNFREWEGSPDRLEVQAKRMGNTLLHILDSIDGSLCAASTVQGIEGYRDDSAFTGRVVNGLPLPYRERVNILKNHFTASEYFALAGNFDFSIGMRMHGSLIAMHAGCPAMSIGYENKTKEIFRDMGLSQFATDIYVDEETGNSKISNFLSGRSGDANEVSSVFNKFAEDEMQFTGQFSDLISRDHG